MNRVISLACSAALPSMMSACDGSHESASALENICESIGGGTAHITSTTTGCELDPMESLHAALDVNYDSFALLHGPAGYCAGYAAHTVVLATAQSGIVFPAGRSAGALFRMPEGAAAAGSSFEMTVTTYLDGVPQNSAPAAQETGTGWGRHGEDVYYGIGTTSAYDSIELTFDVSGLCAEHNPDGEGNDGSCTSDVRIYEVCTQ